MQGYLSIVLHAHLPFVRHPEHEKFLEESWLFEAITETYIPLIQTLEGWRRDGIEAHITLSLSPTLCTMLLDPLLRGRYERHLNGLVDLAEKEIHRTHWDRAFRELAWMYHHKFTLARETWRHCEGNLVGAFRKFQDEGRIEIITTGATHGLLPLLANHPPSIRAQILTARDHYRSCFGRDPRGIWLPECAYVAGVETFLQEANIRWFILDTHGVLHAKPRPRYGTFAPVFTPNGIAAFGRDFDSSRQVWSKHEGYPGDVRYRDFYRDIGFDLDFDYVKPHLPSPDNRGFTGMKYYRITGGAGPKEIYQRDHALQAASEHARHFLNERVTQVERLAGILDRPPLIIAPYDAELFGHWWYEGPEFLDFFARQLR
jgi:1,4-alpha-glucan branching enzyme